MLGGCKTSVLDVVVTGQCTGGAQLRSGLVRSSLRVARKLGRGATGYPRVRFRSLDLRRCPSIAADRGGGGRTGGRVARRSGRLSPAPFLRAFLGMVVRLPSRRMTLSERGRPGGCCQWPPGGSAVPSQSHRSVANVGSSGIAHLGLRPIDCGPSGGKDRLAGIARYGTRPPRRLFARPVEAGEPSEPAPASSVGRRRSPRPSSRSGCSLTNRRRPKL
jgi:hypothetical protein